MRLEAVRTKRSKPRARGKSLSRNSVTFDHLTSVGYSNFFSKTEWNGLIKQDLKSKVR